MSRRGASNLTRIALLIVAAVGTLAGVGLLLDVAIGSAPSAIEGLTGLGMIVAGALIYRGARRLL